jgi:hypothetical protein
VRHLPVPDNGDEQRAPLLPQVRAGDQSRGAAVRDVQRGKRLPGLVERLRPLEIIEDGRRQVSGTETPAGLPWEYRDADGDVLRIAEAGRPGMAYVQDCGAGVVVDAEGVLAITAKLREAAGMPAGVILARPEIDPAGTASVGPFRLALDTGQVALGHIICGKVASETGLEPAEARELSAYLAAYADAQEALGA